MSNIKSITPAQCRGARAMLGWSQEQLASAANLTRQTIAHFESETRTPGPNNVLAIKVALESQGVIFIDRNGGGPGVRLKDG
jgi:DNA-binding XRE family transcriptional regulator